MPNDSDWRRAREVRTREIADQMRIARREGGAQLSEREIDKRAAEKAEGDVRRAQMKQDRKG